MKTFGIRVAWGCACGAALGTLAGAGEVVARSFGGIRLLSTVPEWLVLYGAGAVLYGVTGAVLGLLATVPWALLATRRRGVDAYRKATGRHLLAPTLAPVCGLVAAGLMVLVDAPDLVDWVRDPARRRNAVASLLVDLAIGGVVGGLAWRRFRRSDEGQGARPSLVTGVAALVALGAAAGVVAAPRGRSSGEDTTPESHNLLVVTLDTLRANRVGALGGASGARTPALDALARDGVLFRQAIAPIPETGPSHASMFTGLHPLRHGVRSNADVLSPRFTTLAERLGGAGYTTAAFLSAYALDSRIGLAQGFQVYDDDFSTRVRGLNALSLRQLYIRLVFALGQPALLSEVERPGPATVSRALTWLEAHQDQRFLLWVHLFDAHAPYIPHGLAGFEDNGTPGSPALDHPRLLDARGNRYEPDEVARLKRLYAEEVTFVDTQLGVLLDGLRRFGLDRNTAIAVLGDHGESMDEHGVFFSHVGLYDTVLRVPMVLRIPWDSSARADVGAQVRVIDLYPTLTETLGLPATGPVDGSSLLPLIHGIDDSERQALVMGRMGHIGSEELVGLRSREWKYLRRSDGREEFYLLRDDPCEVSDVAASQSAAVASARAGLADLLGDGVLGPAAASPGMDDELAAKLAALGYVGSDPTPPAASAPAAPPGPCEEPSAAGTPPPPPTSATGTR